MSQGKVQLVIQEEWQTCFSLEEQMHSHNSQYVSLREQKCSGKCLQDIQTNLPQQNQMWCWITLNIQDRLTEVTLYCLLPICENKQVV
jgi:hypothetical protein